MAKAIAQLIEIAVDLARPTGRQRDQTELRVNAIEQLLDLGIDHRVERASGHEELSPENRGWPEKQPEIQRPTLPAQAPRSGDHAMVADDLHHLANGSLEVVVHHHVVR